MDAETYAEAIQYELLTQAVYDAILKQEGEKNIEVQHNTKIKGRSGVEHQVDVSWRFKKATIEHTVLIECKSYTSALTLEKVRNFFAVLHDIGNCQGLMVTKTGYQAGVTEFAKFYGIELKLLRKPTEEDWEGRIKDIHVNLHVIGLATSPGKVPKVTLELAPQNQPLKESLVRQELASPSAPDMVFVNAEGIPLTEELRWWLPRMLGKDGNFEGGPFTKDITFDDHYLEMADKSGHVHLVKVQGLHVEYYKELLETREIISSGENIVEAILKDFSTGELEHVHRK